MLKENLQTLKKKKVTCFGINLCHCQTPSLRMHTGSSHIFTLTDIGNIYGQPICIYDGVYQCKNATQYIIQEAIITTTCLQQPSEMLTLQIIFIRYATA